MLYRPGYKLGNKLGRLLICYGVEEKDTLGKMLSNPQTLKREFCCRTSAREQG